MEITREIYIRDFSEYIDLIKNESLEFEEIFSYIKSHDDYIIDLDKKQDDIVDELKAWRKYYLNSMRKKHYLKTSFRDFEPILTRGEIEEFITNKLRYFDVSTGEFIGVEAAFEKILRQQLYNIQETRDLVHSVNQLINTYQKVKKITGIDILNTDVNELKKFTLDSYNRLSALQMREIIENLIPKNVGQVLSENMSKVNRNNFIDFVFDAITDYKLYDLDDSSANGIRQRLEFRFREFVNRGLFKLKPNKKLEATDVFDVAVRMFDNVKNDFIRSRDVFKFNFTNSLIRAMNKELSAFDFNRNVRAMLRGYGRQAFRSGILGLGLDPNDFRPIENFLIRKMNSYVNYYITNLSTKIVTGSIDVGKALITSDSWSNRVLNRFFEYGRLAADRNGLYEWVYGDTKHCNSCLRANGQRHRLRHWYDSGILPQSNGHKTLICKGFHCKCKLVKVSGSSRGRLDRIPVL